MSTSAYSSEMIDGILSTIPSQLHPFLQLSYPINHTSPPRLRTASTSPSLLSDIFDLLRGHSHPDRLYDKGPLDLCIPITCAVMFTVLRNVSMQYVFSPFARYWLTNNLEREKSTALLNGKSNGNGMGAGGESDKNAKERRMKLTKLERRKLEHTVLRFAEQSWSFVYCTIFWSLGVIIMSRLQSPLSPESLWGSYPLRHLPALTKFYYLAQLGWWFHQIYVINTEKRRSDHYQMLTHHCLSITLIVGSYVANFTRIGTLLHNLMDFCDILLPLAKLFRYLSLIKLCDFTFVAFFVGWLVSRQIGLAFVIYTSYHYAPQYIQFRWDPASGQYLTPTTYRIFIGMQMFLYSLATVWFYMALMVAVRVVTGQGAEDTRSDDEFEGESVGGDTSLELEDVPDAHTSSTRATTSMMSDDNDGDGRPQGDGLRNRK